MALISSRLRWLASGLAALCLASVTTGLLPPSAAAGSYGETVADEGFTAQIRRTEYGIPHILAHDYSGLRRRHIGRRAGGLRHVQRSLADAVRSLESAGLPVDTTLGTVQRWAEIPLPGCGGGEGCFNVVHAGPDSGSSGAVYPTSLDHYAGGSSFVMAVELTPHGPRTRTILTYGESVNPASPHFADQTALFSHKRWVTERFTDVEINADPSLRITTLRR
jgi:acyl-homoserine lactone acylase PvdQ